MDSAYLYEAVTLPRYSFVIAARMLLRAKVCHSCGGLRSRAADPRSLHPIGHTERLVHIARDDITPWDKLGPRRRSCRWKVEDHIRGVHRPPVRACRAGGVVHGPPLSIQPWADIPGRSVISEVPAAVVAAEHWKPRVIDPARHWTGSGIGCEGLITIYPWAKAR